VGAPTRGRPRNRTRRAGQGGPVATLLGILDKATLTLGDNRRVDLSQCIIILTSNLGTSEMGNLVDGGMGFNRKPKLVDSSLDDKIDRTAVEAARRGAP
jgi:ATP-dependent Clp protease ATP-binding subunit ClpA